MKYSLALFTGILVSHFTCAQSTWITLNPGANTCHLIFMQNDTQTHSSSFSRLVVPVLMIRGGTDTLSTWARSDNWPTENRIVETDSSAHMEVVFVTETADIAQLILFKTEGYWGLMGWDMLPVLKNEYDTISYQQISDAEGKLIWSGFLAKKQQQIFLFSKEGKPLNNDAFSFLGLGNSISDLIEKMPDGKCYIPVARKGTAGVMLIAYSRVVQVAIDPVDPSFVIDTLLQMNASIPYALNAEWNLLRVPEMKPVFKTWCEGLRFPYFRESVCGFKNKLYYGYDDTTSIVFNSVYHQCGQGTEFNDTTGNVLIRNKNKWLLTNVGTGLFPKGGYSTCDVVVINDKVWIQFSNGSNTELIRLPD